MFDAKIINAFHSMGIDLTGELHSKLEHELLRIGYKIVKNAPEQIPVVGNPPLEWTKDVPTKEGYYFCRYVDNQIKSLNKINIYRLHKCPYTDNENNRSLLVENTSLNNYKGAEWAGPIPEPQ